VGSQRAETRKSAVGGGDGQSQESEEGQRGGAGGYGVPSKKYLAEPYYDSTGGIPLIDPVTRRIQSGALGPTGIGMATVEDGGQRGFDALESSGIVKQTTTQRNGTTAKNIASGRQTIGTAKHGDSVTFPTNYQNPPAVNIFGGVSHEPASVWATTIAGIPGLTAPSTTTRQVDDVVAYNVTASGCSIRAILKQSGTTTPQTNAYDTGAITTIGGTKEVTTANAPAANDTYTSDYTYSFTLQGTEGLFASQTAVVSLDYFNGSVWIDDIATHTYSGGTDTGFPLVISGSDTLVATQTGLTTTSKFRIRVKSHTKVGGVTPLTRSVDPGNCAYSTATGEIYAGKTPSATGIVLNVEIIGAS